MYHYRHIALSQNNRSGPKLEKIVQTALDMSPNNRIAALEQVLRDMLEIQTRNLTKPIRTERETKLYDQVFRLYLARQLETIYSKIFQGVTAKNAMAYIHKRNDSGDWEPLTSEDWQPTEKTCIDRQIRYSRIPLTTIMSKIELHLIAFVFLPLGETAQRSLAEPTATPIHDHSAPCTGATIFQDAKSFSMEDRFTETPNGVDFLQPSVWVKNFQPVTDLKNDLQPTVIHRVSYHSYAPHVSPTLRVHIYGSKTPNRKMDYQFESRSFTTDDLPENKRKTLFRQSSFFGGLSAHEA